MYNPGETLMTPERRALIEQNWRRTLDGIPTLLGRLAYLASLRNPATCVYEHAGLAGRIGSDEAEALLARSHAEVFRQWLGLKLREQEDELREYFNSLDAGAGQIVRNWLTIEPYSGWIPADSRDAERELFRTDLEIVLAKLRGAFDVTVPDRE